MEGINKARPIALAVTTTTIISIAVISFIFFAFQSSTSSSSTSEQPGMIESSSPKLHDILLIANENLLKIAPDNELYPGGLWYTAMTFNGTIPGPLITANQGDMLRITLKNEGEFVHSLNFHAGFGPSQALSGAVSAGDNKTWTMKVNYPGAFLYHCDGDNLNGIWEHIADGMYGGIVVRSLDEQHNSAKEFYVAFSEIYDTQAQAPFTTNQSAVGNNNVNHTAAGTFDIEKFIAQKPDLILTNGMAFRYIQWIGTEAKIVLNPDAEAFHVRAGELTKWYIFNAGPRNNIAFNFGAGLVKEDISNNGNNSSSSSYVDNNATDGKVESTEPSSLLSNKPYGEGYYDEVVDIPPGSGTVIDVTFPEPGTYFGNDHDVGSILYGAGFVVIAE